MVEAATLPSELAIVARDVHNPGLTMAIAHRELPVVGFQFHPEAILTECGPELLRNFLRLAGIASDPPPAWSDAALLRPAGENWPATATPITF
jgi:hypothetical protein